MGEQVDVLRTMRSNLTNVLQLLQNGGQNTSWLADDNFTERKQNIIDDAQRLMDSVSYDFISEKVRNENACTFDEIHHDLQK